MSDKYQQIANSSLGKSLFKALGLPAPVELERQNRPDADFIKGQVLAGSAVNGSLVASLLKILDESSASICCQAGAESSQQVFSEAKKTGVHVSQIQMVTPIQTRFQALVFDASGIDTTEALQALHSFFQPVISRLAQCGRIVVLGRPVAECQTPAAAAAQRALEGFTRSLGKEVGRKGATVQLIYVSRGAEEQLASPLRFCLSPRSAYVSGQVLRVSTGSRAEAIDWSQPLAGKTVLVTGASRGIGEAIAEVAVRDGAQVVCLDIPQARDALEAVASRLGGTTILADITADKAPDQIAAQLQQLAGGVDVVIHNAGITLDKTLGKMKPEWWEKVININLSAEERINDVLLERQLLRENGRIVCVSSLSGLAGNFGQTNYAVSKAGVAGYVQAMAPVLAEKTITINAVAPGFIETRMTAAIPLLTREAGRRMNSLSQGGLPQDVAEAILFFASPASTGMNGNILRVCGQSLLGA